MSEIKLSPCPFCGGEAYLYEDEKHNAYVVGCKNCCDVEPITKVCKSKEEAIDRWNTRKPMQEIVERLEEECKEYRNSDWLLRDKAIKVGTMTTAMDIVKEVGGLDV